MYEEVEIGFILDLFSTRKCDHARASVLLRFCEFSLFNLITWAKLNRSNDTYSAISSFELGESFCFSIFKKMGFWYDRIYFLDIKSLKGPGFCFERNLITPEQSLCPIITTIMNCSQRATLALLLPSSIHGTIYYRLGKYLLLLDPSITTCSV